MLSIDLRGRTAVVTGASSGIGAATAVAFARCGARIIAVGRDENRLAEVESRIAAEGGEGEALAADLIDAEGLDRIVSAAGPDLHILALAAGHAEETPIASADRAQLDRLWKIHVEAPLLLIQRCLGRLAEGSSILLYGSTTGRMGLAANSGYTAVKGAVEAMARSLAIELGPRTRVNTIVPGFTETPMVTDQFGHDDELKRGIVARTPLGFIGGPETAANLAAFVCSDLAPYLHGASLVVDGGWTAQGWQVPGDD